MGPTKASKHILIVDDESAIRDLLLIVINLLGDCHVSQACHGEEALLIVKKGPVDLIITDLAMPKMNGFEFLRRLKNLGHSIPTLVLTGNGDHRVTGMITNFGVSEFLDKPWNNDELLKIIKRILLQKNKQVAAS